MTINVEIIVKAARSQMPIVSTLGGSKPVRCPGPFIKSICGSNISAGRLPRIGTGKNRNIREPIANTPEIVAYPGGIDEQDDSFVYGRARLAELLEFVHAPFGDHFYLVRNARPQAPPSPHPALTQIHPKKALLL